MSRTKIVTLSFRRFKLFRLHCSNASLAVSSPLCHLNTSYTISMLLYRNVEHVVTTYCEKNDNSCSLFFSSELPWMVVFVILHALYTLNTI